MQRVIVPKGPRAAQARAQDWLADTRQPPLPDWLVLRDVQLDAVEQIARGYEAGNRVMFLDAPTGTGKTIMGELARRRMEVTRGLYVCTTKSLQEQVARDFGYARVLKGRANYLPTNITTNRWDGYTGEGSWGKSLAITCADCDRGPRDAELEEQSCSYCNPLDCPYLAARGQASVAAMGVLNTAFMLTHLNGGGGRAASPFRDRELVVADECDLLEDELLGYVEFRLGAKIADTLGVEVPKKGSHMTTIRRWLEEEVIVAVKQAKEQLRGGDLETRRARNRYDQLLEDARRVVEREEGWVREGDEEKGGGLVLKPVSVEDVGDRYLWRHAERWLCMSGTVVSAETLAEGLGLEEAGIAWDVVRLDMPFERDARRVVYAPTMSMTRKGQEAAGGLDKMFTAVHRVLDKHPDVNVLIHTFSYRLAQEISGQVRGRDPAHDPRPVITYTDGRGREDALASFKAAAQRGGAIMVAASMGRGVDLPGDLCRVQIVAKMPMASLGSRQVSERLRVPGGQDWYLASTVRSLMQMTGRGVRNMDDWCVTYVLDEHFGKVLKDGKRRGMFPAWWLDALELGRL